MEQQNCDPTESNPVWMVVLSREPNGSTVTKQATMRELFRVPDLSVILKYLQVVSRTM